MKRVGKATSRRWQDSYNIEDSGLEQVSRIDMRYNEFRKITEEEKLFLHGFDGPLETEENGVWTQG